MLGGVVGDSQAGRRSDRTRNDVGSGSMAARSVGSVKASCYDNALPGRHMARRAAAATARR